MCVCVCVFCMSVCVCVIVCKNIRVTSRHTCRRVYAVQFCFILSIKLGDNNLWVFKNEMEYLAVRCSIRQTHVKEG